MKTPLQELMEYMEQNQYFIGNDLLEKYKELIEKEKQEYISCWIRAYTKDFINPLDRKFYYDLAEQYYYTFINPLGTEEEASVELVINDSPIFEDLQGIIEELNVNE